LCEDKSTGSILEFEFTLRKLLLTGKLSLQTQTDTVVRKCVEFCTNRQNVDSNATGRMVIAYCTIKPRDTNWYGDKKMCRVLYR
jgi:hypothetical protein